MVVIGAVLGAFNGYLLDSRGNAEYQATSTLLISPGSGSGGERYVQNEFVILGSHAVAEQAASNLGNMSTTQVRDGITLQRIPDSDLVRIVATRPSPESAQSLANAYADGYLELAEERLDTGRSPEVDELDAAIDEIEADLGEVDADIAAAMNRYLDDPAGILVPDIEQVSPALATERSILLEQYSQLLVARNQLELAGEETLGSRVTEYATGPAIAVGPGSKLVVVVGFTAGVMLGALGAVAHSRLSGMILDRSEAASMLHVPVVATISNESHLARRRLLPGDPVPAELADEVHELAVRAETSVPSSDAGHGALVLLVTGAERCSGTTTIAVALAGNFAAKGSEVILVDADLAHPELTDLLGGGNSGVGMLIGNRPDSTSTRTSPLRSVATSVEFAGLGTDHARQSLRRQDVGVLLDSAAQYAQVVVIDGGVLMASAAAVELAQRADAVVLTMPARRQSRDGLEVAARALASRRGGLLPVIIAARRRRDGATVGPVAAADHDDQDVPVMSAVDDEKREASLVEVDDVTANQAEPSRRTPGRRARQPAPGASPRGASRGT